MVRTPETSHQRSPSSGRLACCWAGRLVRLVQLDRTDTASVLCRAGSTGGNAMWPRYVPTRSFLRRIDPLSRPCTPAESLFSDQNWVNGWARAYSNGREDQSIWRASAAVSKYTSKYAVLLQAAVNGLTSSAWATQYFPRVVRTMSRCAIVRIQGSK